MPMDPANPASRTHATASASGHGQGRWSRTAASEQPRRFLGHGTFILIVAVVAVVAVVLCSTIAMPGLVR